MSNFLPIPAKRALPLTSLSQHLLDYISGHFRDAHPEAFRKDVDRLVAMRKELVEAPAEAHPEIVRGLMRYHAQLTFLSTKFPSNIAVNIIYHLPYPSLYSMTPDAPVSLHSLTFERASVLYNIAALYASMAAAERRAEIDGIKRALGFLTLAAGTLDHIIKAVLPTLQGELSTPHAAGYDMTESFLGALREFVLAEAQECFWQQAVLQGTYKNALIGKLSMKVSEYNKAALALANGTDSPSAGFFPQAWIAHVTIKQMHFEAAAQYRLSQEDLEKSRYGEEIARLRVAEGLVKKGLDVNKKGVSDAVISDLKSLQAAIKAALERAVRDNDLVYVAAVPPASQLASIVGTGMVKLTTPPEVTEPLNWLMSPQSGMEPLFSALVPYGVHLALSVYDDRRDTLVRELDGKREEMDGIAASTLQSLNLPGSIQALDRPVGLPPSLLRKVEEVESGGGADRIRSLLSEVDRLSAANNKLLSDSTGIIDQEERENQAMLARQPHLARDRVPSETANAHLMAAATQYRNTISMAAQSDATVKTKWEESKDVVGILASGEDAILDYIPSTSGTSVVAPLSVRPLRASLEDLDDIIAHRATLVVEAKQIAANDDVRPAVLKEATRLAHGGSGDVKSEWFEGIFDKSLVKYQSVQDDMSAAEARQDELLSQIREQNSVFLSERKEDPKIRERERKLQEMDGAYWKWREIIDNAEEGIKFHNSFAEMLNSFKTACVQFLNSRRADVGQITSGLRNASISSDSSSSTYTRSQPSSPPPRSFSSHAPSPPPQTFHSPPISHPSAPTSSTSTPFSMPHPNSTTWTSTSDLLPPPPPAPILRSGGIPTQANQPPLVIESPRRVTRSSTAASGRGPIGDSERNPYKAGSRREGGGVV